MIAYFLDYTLSRAERRWVQTAVGEPITLTKVPWLFPLREDDPPLAAERVLPHLRRAHIEEQRGRRVLLIAPQELRWYTSLAEGIRHETGHYPLLVQPKARRAEVGCPGPLRILDLEAYLQDEDATTVPPWLTPD